MCVRSWVVASRNNLTLVFFLMGVRFLWATPEKILGRAIRNRPCQPNSLSDFSRAADHPQRAAASVANRSILIEYRAVIDGWLYSGTAWALSIDIPSRSLVAFVCRKAYGTNGDTSAARQALFMIVANQY